MSNQEGSRRARAWALRVQRSEAGQGWLDLFEVKKVAQRNVEAGERGGVQPPDFGEAHQVLRGLLSGEINQVKRKHHERGDIVVRRAVRPPPAGIATIALGHPERIAGGARTGPRLDLQPDNTSRQLEQTVGCKAILDGCRREAVAQQEAVDERLAGGTNGAGMAAQSVRGNIRVVAQVFRGAAERAVIARDQGVEGALGHEVFLSARKGRSS